MSYIVYHKDGRPAGRVTPINRVTLVGKRGDYKVTTKYVFKPLT